MAHHVSSLGLLALLGTMSTVGCKPKQDSDTLSRTAFAELGTLPDSELFKRNECVSITLSQEIRRQLLAAVSASKNMFKEISTTGSDLILTEVGISKGESKVMDFDVTADLRVAPKGSTANSSTGFNLGEAQPDPWASVATGNTANTGTTAGTGTATNPWGSTTTTGTTGTDPWASSYGSSYGGNFGGTYATGNCGAVSSAGGAAQGGNNSSGAPLGANVSTSYHVLTTNYTVSFAFEDKKAGSNGEVYRFALKQPLNLEENLKITSRVQLSLNAISVLPKFLGDIVARFYQDIGASLNTGMSWERSAQLSTRMFYKVDNKGVTPLMTDLMKDVVRPLCLKAAAVRGQKRAACDFNTPKITDPLEDLSKRITTKMRIVRRCEATDMRENMLKIYKLYTDVREGSNAFAEGGKAYLFHRVKGGWQRGIDLSNASLTPLDVYRSFAVNLTPQGKLGALAANTIGQMMESSWAKVMPVEETKKCLSPEKGVICMPLRFGSLRLNDSKCRDITAGFITIGVYNQDVKQLMD